MKYHCDYYYGTNKNDKSLTPCDLKWKMLFNTPSLRKILRHCVKESRSILLSLNLNIKLNWLKVNLKMNINK